MSTGPMSEQRAYRRVRHRQRTTWSAAVVVAAIIAAGCASSAAVRTVPPATAATAATGDTIATAPPSTAPDSGSAPTVSVPVPTGTPTTVPVPPPATTAAAPVTLDTKAAWAKMVAIYQAVAQAVAADTTGTLDRSEEGLPDLVDCPLASPADLLATLPAALLSAADRARVQSWAALPTQFRATDPVLQCVVYAESTRLALLIAPAPTGLFEQAISDWTHTTADQQQWDPTVPLFGGTMHPGVLQRTDLHEDKSYDAFWIDANMMVVAIAQPNGVDPAVTASSADVAAWLQALLPRLVQRVANTAVDTVKICPLHCTTNGSAPPDATPPAGSGSGSNASVTAAAAAAAQKVTTIATTIQPDGDVGIATCPFSTPTATAALSAVFAVTGGELDRSPTFSRYDGDPSVACNDSGGHDLQLAVTVTATDPVAALNDKAASKGFVVRPVTTPNGTVYVPDYSSASVLVASQEAIWYDAGVEVRIRWTGSLADPTVIGQALGAALPAVFAAVAAMPDDPR